MEFKFFVSAIIALFMCLVAVAIVAGEQAFAQSSVVNHGIAGDWDTKDTCREVANLMALNGVKTVIGLGDYEYRTSAAQWWHYCFHNNRDLSQPILGPGWSMWGAIGNHDKDEKPAYMGIFGQDAPVTKTIRDKHYQIFMDTSEHQSDPDTCVPEENADYSFGSPQYDTVKLFLEDAKAKKASGDINWISVSLHCNVYSSSSQHPPTTDIRFIYQQLWEDNDVDFVFSGHNHNYERTYPLTWTGTNAQICNPGQRTGYVDLDDKDCIIFFTVGTGGRNGEDLRSPPPEIVVGDSDLPERTEPYGYLNMGIDNEKGEIRFQMFKTDGKTISDFTVKRTIGSMDNGSNGNTTIQFNKTKALNFIKSMYDPTDGMVKECPTCTKKWLWSDQLLAQIALKHIDPQMAATIETKMNSFNKTMKNPWATLDAIYMDSFSVGATTEQQVGNSNVWYSDYSGSELPCTSYADIAFLKAIHYFNKGNEVAAKTCYDQGKATWDGTGMDDEGSITGDYAVYKTALGLLAQKITGFEPIGIPINYFDRFQAVNGGVTTDITAGQPHGSQNVETTFAVLAAIDPSILIPPEPPIFNLNCPIGPPGSGSQCNAPSPVSISSSLTGSQGSESQGNNSSSPPQMVSR